MRGTAQKQHTAMNKAHINIELSFTHNLYLYLKSCHDLLLTLSHAFTRDSLFTAAQAQTAAAEIHGCLGLTFDSPSTCLWPTFELQLYAMFESCSAVMALRPWPFIILPPTLLIGGKIQAQV